MFKIIPEACTDRAARIPPWLYVTQLKPGMAVAASIYATKSPLCCPGFESRNSCGQPKKLKQPAGLSNPSYGLVTRGSLQYVAHTHLKVVVGKMALAHDLREKSLCCGALRVFGACHCLAGGCDRCWSVPALPGLIDEGYSSPGAPSTVLVLRARSPPCSAGVPAWRQMAFVL